MDKIALALGLAQGASEDEILVAINTALTSVAAMRTSVDAMAVAAGLAAGAKADDVVVAIQSAAGKVDPTKYVPVAALVTLQADLNALRTKVDSDGAMIAVNKAITDGKLAPALKDWGISLYKADPAQFDAYVGAAPVLTATQRAAVVPPSNGEPVLTDSDLAVMSQMGLTREAYVASLKGVAA